MKNVNSLKDYQAQLLSVQEQFFKQQAKMHDDTKEVMYLTFLSHCA